MTTGTTVHIRHAEWRKQTLVTFARACAIAPSIVPCFRYQIGVGIDGRTYHP